MKIALVCIGAENLGLEYLSAILKKEGHEVKLFYDPSLFDDKFIFSIPYLNKLFNIRNIVIKNLIKFNPGLVGFSVCTDAYRWALEVATEIKKNINVPILFGGTHPTSVPEKVLRQEMVDIVNIGEGFGSLPELARKMENNEDYSGIRNLWLKKENKMFKNEIREAFPNLDNLPFPDKDLFREHFNISDNYLIMTSFGCPYQCTYCSNDLFLKMYRNKGSFIRRRSVENVIQELKIAHKKYKLKVINFMDDIFTTDKKWLKRFFDAYKEEFNLPYKVISHPRYMDEEIIKLLKNTGCYRVEIGVQTVNEEIRRKILKRIETNEEIVKTFSLCEKYKLGYMIDHIYGIPTEGSANQLEAARFYSDFKPARVANFWLVYYPKTAISDMALDMKLLSEKDIDLIEEGHMKTYHEGGSVTDEEQKKIFENFIVFFLLIPLLPRKLNRKLAKSKLLFKLHSIPYFVQIALDFIGGLKYKDYDTITYAKYYLKYIFRIIGIKVNHRNRRRSNQHFSPIK